jgi:O-antigen ligase
LESSLTIHQNRNDLFGFYLFIGFLIVLALFGGASRADALSQPVARLFAVIALALWSCYATPQEWMRVRAPMLFLVAAAVAIAIQLIPLPPAIWTSMPGREPWFDPLASFGLAANWRPISLTPDLTLNSLLALLPAMAMIAILSMLSRERMPALIKGLLILLLCSALLGVMQVGSGAGYLYEVTNRSNAVGFFANRNHQAMLLACGFPLLACWVALPSSDRRSQRLKLWVALCAAAAIFPLLLITGSRAGLVLGGLAVLVALPLGLTGSRAPLSKLLFSRAGLLAALPVAVGAAAVIAAILLARDEALQRLTEGEQGGLRWELLPTYLRMIQDFLPVGSGFGSFDPVFRFYEPDSHLRLTYLNQAHNDWVQIVIEGGVVGAAFVLLFCVWFVLSSWRAWRQAPSNTVVLARLGSVVITILLIGSAADYPLRTPLLSAVFALAAFLLHRARRRPRGADDL